MFAGTLALGRYKLSTAVKPIKYKDSDRAKPIRSAERARLQFPPAHIRSFMRNYVSQSRVSMTAGVFLAAIIEYITTQLCMGSVTYAKVGKHIRITNRDGVHCISDDGDLANLLNSS